MAIKEGENSSDNYPFIKKYIRDDSDKENLKDEDKKHFSLKNFRTENQSTIEIFGQVGEGGSYPENTNFNKRPDQENEGFEASNEEVESISKPASDAKKEFLKHLEDDSLSIDTCNKLNHDWKRG